LDGQRCHIHPTLLTSHHEIVTYDPFKRDICKDNILPITRNSKAMHQRYQGREEGEQLSLGIGIICPCSKVKDCQQRWRIYLKITMPSATM